MDKIPFNVKSAPRSKLVTSKLIENAPEEDNIEYLNVFSSNTTSKPEKPLVIKPDTSRSFDKKIHQAVDSRADFIEQYAIDELTNGGIVQPKPSNKRKIVLEQSDESDPEDPDYSKVPVEGFGMAMIRGMGWKEGMGVGKTFKSVCPVRDVVKRPHLMGLGVEAALNRGEFLSGGSCVIRKGNHKGHVGIVESFVNGTVRVKISLIGKVVNLPPAAVKMITVDQNNRKNGNLEEQKTEPKKEAVKPVPNHVTSWLKVNLLVRFIDNSSPHYRARGVIKEITGPNTCNCALEMGSYTARDVGEEELETVLPQNSDELVCVVKGEFAGKVGRVVRKDRSKRTAMVELMGNPQSVSLRYSEICCTVSNTV